MSASTLAVNLPDSWLPTSDNEQHTHDPTWSTPQQLKPESHGQWNEQQTRSPMTSISVTSTPSMADTISTASNVGPPMTPQSLLPLPPSHPLAPLDKSPVPPETYGLSVFTGMDGQLAVPGVTNMASHEGDGSLNLNGLTGDGSNGGYDASGFGGDGSGGFGGDDHFGHNGNGGYGPPGGGAGGEGPPDGSGGDPGDGGPPPPPPKGKKLALACHFCRRRKLKCDGIRPECENCSKRGEKCSYDDNVRRRGPGKRTKEMRQRAGPDALRADVEGTFASFALADPTQQQQEMPIPGPSHTPGNYRPMAPASTTQFNEDSIPSSSLPEIDPNIDPALAILGMGIDPPPDDGVTPATLAEADPTRGSKRKSDLVTDDSGKRLKLEDETYEAALPDHTGIGVGVGVGSGSNVGVGVGVGTDVGVSGLEVPDFSAWGTTEGREGEVDEEDLAKFENDLRRVIQDQAEAEAKALDQEQAQGQ